ncbi:MAG: hypothetical protein LAO24_21635 [Acidobacteriia bacterium]|nr:hypothetical protein [Terriglobia bacterium]
MSERNLKEMLAESLDMIVDLGEAINGQVLQMSAMLTALAETVPGFAQAFEQAHAAEIAEQENSDSVGNPSVREALDRIRKLREK